MPARHKRKKLQLLTPIGKEGVRKPKLFSGAVPDFQHVCVIWGFEKVTSYFKSVCGGKCSALAVFVGLYHFMTA